MKPSHGPSKGFTLIELLVVVAVLGLLIAIMIPSLAVARKRARTAICMTNQRCLVGSYRTYFTANGNVLSSTGHGNSGAWDFQLLGTGKSVLDYYTYNGLGSTVDKMRWCPETASARRFSGPMIGTATLAWDCRYGPGGGSTGSYGMNNWVYDGSTYQRAGGFRWGGGFFTGSPTSPTNPGDFYQLRNAQREFAIPVFVDCVWHDILPRTTDTPGTNLEDPESGSSADRNLADATLSRHGKAVNVSFWDNHVETVKLPDLWTIRWSASWDRTTPMSIP
jgi:prepilin-type N-terminal cleavage/methylation domain-containing protein/prepilin-type processing-associated H-X9-DG protein